MITKSGSNSIHGSLYEYFRNKVLNANDFFSNRNGVPRAPFTQNQYGASLGGPVIPNKTFFFSSWEGFKLRTALPSTFTVPTASFRAGNFAGQPTIYDPLTTCGGAIDPTCPRNANGTPVITRIPFPNNQIPASRFDPTTLVMQKYWPLPNGTGTVNNYVLNFPTGPIRTRLAAVLIAHLAINSGFLPDIRGGMWATVPVIHSAISRGITITISASIKSS